jgi:uncharacterized protein (DUF1697 family)
MTVFVALLRAINVGGTGTLSMKELSALCADLGLKKIRTYIQSGNVVFESLLSEAALRDKLEQALTKRMEKRIDVVVRTASELRSVVEANPFSDAAPEKVAVFFRSDLLPKGLLDNLVIPGWRGSLPG